LQAPLDLCGRKTAQLVPNNRLIVYEHAAHGLFHTHAGRLNADLRAFVLDEATGGERERRVSTSAATRM
jgi:pimeloyl-ACP methyl ester carboxylesterase